jgi:hypothetical protein
VKCDRFLDKKFERRLQGGLGKVVADKELFFTTYVGEVACIIDKTSGDLKESTTVATRIGEFNFTTLPGGESRIAVPGLRVGQSNRMIVFSTFGGSQK